MSDLNLTNIPPTLLKEWTDYARRSGLPLEYLILEAVTYSVRSDRLGIDAATILVRQRQHQLALSKKIVQKDATHSQVAPSLSVPVPKIDPLVVSRWPLVSDDDSLNSDAVLHHLPLEYMDSNESSAALEDFVPRNL